MKRRPPEPTTDLDIPAEHCGRLRATDWLQADEIPGRHATANEREAASVLAGRRQRRAWMVWMDDNGVHGWSDELREHCRVTGASRPILWPWDEDE